MTSSLLAVRGAQEPRVRHVPPRVEPDEDSPGVLACQLAETAGLRLDDWQRLVLIDALSLRLDGRWAAREVGLVVPRQNGKGSVLEALELAALFMPEPGGPPPLVLHSAHEYKTADEHFRRMRDLIEGSDRLRKQVRIVRTASGAQAIELVTGARLRFVTRTKGSGRGFSPDLVVMDEAFNLSDESLAATNYAMSARPNAQLWYTSSAGMPDSDVLARVRERGLKGGDPVLAYFEWSAADDADLDDPQVWAQANPALGIRIDIDTVRSERLSSPPEQFARERLGMWATERRDSAFDPAAWSLLADPASERGHPVVWGVAVAPDQSWAALCVAWKRPDGLTQAQVADYRPGTAWLAERLDEVRGRWGGDAYVDRFAKPLVDGVTPQFEAACATFAAAVAAGTVRHGNQGELNTSIKAARWRASGDGRVLDRKGTADISPLIAAALAMHGLNQAATESNVASFFAF